MGNFAGALADFKKNWNSPMALLTGGASLAVTGTKAAMKKPSAPQGATAQAAAAPAPQGAQAAGRPAVGGGGSRPGGGTGTFLTGPDGVDPNALKLGKNMLLGE